MPKATKKKPRSKAVTAGLKAMANMVFETTDLDAQINLIKEKLKPAEIKLDRASVGAAGRDVDGIAVVIINIDSTAYGSLWPDWAYEIAEGALHFNKEMIIAYNDAPYGNNLLEVLCLP